MSSNHDLESILHKLKGTREEEILQKMQELYTKIIDVQAEWYKKSGFTCPQSCGECCRNFEPDLLDCEALYMTAWLIENQKETADKIEKGELPFPENKGCPFWDESKANHCTIYGGRPFICRFLEPAVQRIKKENLYSSPASFTRQSFSKPTNRLSPTDSIQKRKFLRFLVHSR